MTHLSTQKPVLTKSKRRLGRGYGSKKGGHTSSRGQKGQKSRNSVAIWFEGGQLPLIRRTPFIKGKSRFKSLSPKPYVIHSDKLSIFKDGDVITLESLSEKLGLDLKRITKTGVKILKRGEIKAKLDLQVPVSQKLK